MTAQISALSACVSLLGACQVDLPIGVRNDEDSSSGGTNSGTSGVGGSAMAGYNQGGAAGLPSVACGADCQWPEQACIAGECVYADIDPSLALGNAAACFAAGGARSCWGWNAEGQLGLGDFEPRAVPERDVARSDWLEVAGGVGNLLCGLTSDRSLWCWGYGGDGALGLGNLDAQPSPVRVSDVRFARIAPGSGHSCAITLAGELWCWGRNEDGELGTGDTVSTLEPGAVGTSTAWVRVSSGWGHSCGIQQDGSLWCWGKNDVGQLGTGDTEPRPVPLQVGARLDWRSVNARGEHTCAIDAERALWCWGKNEYGQLGLGDTMPRSSPVQVAPGTRWRQVAGGRLQACAISEAEELWCWGAAGTAQPERLTPTLLDGSASWRLVESGYSFACAVRADGSVHCFGSNGSSELGLGDTEARETPTLVLE